MGETTEGGEEGVGLNLGLSIGGCFMGSTEEKDGVLMPAAAAGDTEVGLFQQQRPTFRGMYCRNKEEAEEFLEQRRKREMHALRRQAARRKRDEKRGLLAKAKKPRGAEDGEDEPSGVADGKGMDEEEEERLPRQGQQGVYPGGGFPVVPMMQYVIQNGDKVQYIPVTVPYVLPCWPASSPPPISGAGAVADGFCGADPVAVAARSGSGMLFQPVPCRSFPSEGASGGVNKLAGPQSSSGSSSSAVSDNKSGGGSTSDSRSHSQSSQRPPSEHSRHGSVSSLHLPEAIDKAEGNAAVQSKPPVVPAAATGPQANLPPASKPAASNERIVGNGGEGNQAQAAKSGAPAMPASGAGGRAGDKVLKPPTLPQMPCVSTTGDGPNGKTITGLLYRYTKSEVSIMCVCHGTSFSPAEFIKHAGGTDTANPLRHIIVVPSSVE